MGIDASHGRVGGGVGQKSEHAILGADVVVRRGTRHGLGAPCWTKSLIIASFPRAARVRAFAIDDIEIGPAHTAGAGFT